MTVTSTILRNVVKYQGLSTDTKPTPDSDFPVAWFTESDRGQRFIWDGNAWVKHEDAAIHPLANTFSGDPDGATGVDGTAQTVKTIVIPANSMTQRGDRIRLRSYWTGDNGGPITGTAKLNGITVGTATDGGTASFFTIEAWLHYVDSTHATIIESGSYPATGAASAANVAGFTWDTDQDFDLDQNSVGNNHIVVFFHAADVFPKGVI